MGALDGLLVVSLEQAVAAPFASSRLADAGARVIKIERPEGDFARNYDHVVNGDSAYFVWLNRGKESISMDLSQSQEILLLRSMLKKADVLIAPLNLSIERVNSLVLLLSFLHSLFTRDIISPSI